MIVIVDYGLGNLRSIKYKLQKMKIKTVVSSNKETIEAAEKLILPGVGHFQKGMENIKEFGIREVLDYKVLKEKTPIFGICLGMQLFSQHSEEGNCKGLGWIDSEVVKFNFDSSKKLSIPHVGWNSIKLLKDDPIMHNILPNQYFYFTHSYHLICEDEIGLTNTNYGYNFISSVRKDNIIGTQFHPEKSSIKGFDLLLNFCR